jgi:phosphomannomutase
MPRSAADVRRVIKAYDVRGLVGSELDEAFVRDVGGAFARLMRREGAGSQVVIGYDMRESSPALAAAFADGVTTEGLDVIRIGLASTDELYFASGLLNCPGAMFTASHNPAAYNGIKLCRARAKPVGEDTGLAEIRDDVIAGTPVGHGWDGPTGSVQDTDVLGDYGAFLRSLVDVRALRPLRVAVDAGNGMAGHTAPAVLGAIGSVTLLPLYFELDGSFPNHEANPLEPANLVDLQDFVRRTGADIGLAFDGDADRCFVVDELGQPVTPSAVTALVAARELAREPGATVIHNLITSRVVPEVITESGGTPMRSRVGHSYIKALMADYQRYAASGEINFRVDDAPKCVAAVLDSFADRTVATDGLDGVTVDLGDGAWFNLRTSNTEPLLRLNVEARTAAAVDAIVTQAAERISAT